MPFLRRLRDTLRPGRLDARLDDEFQFHIDQRIEDLIAQGVAPSEARRQAAQLFGNRTCLSESARDRDLLVWLQSTLQDLRYAARAMRRSPAFAAAAVLSLALGIGANTALFSVLDGLLLRLLPVADPGSLSLLKDAGANRFRYSDFELLRSGTRLLDGMAAIMYLPGTLEITDRGQNVPVALQVVSSNYFELLGVSAARGRTFPPPGDAVAVISDRYWRAHYNGSADAIGAHFHWAEWEFTVIGVAPPGFRGVLLDAPADIFLPLETAGIPPDSVLRSRGRSVSLLARLRPGVNARQAAAESSALLRRAIQVEAGGSGISALRERVSRPIVVLECLVAFVLLIACANLANLGLATAASRQREMAVRQAIGAGSGRLIRQLLTESALIALAGGALAIAVARWISDAVLRFLPPNMAGVLPNLTFRLDSHVLAFTAFLTLASCFLFGAAPAVHATRVAPMEGLRQSPGTGHGFSAWLSRGLVVCEVGLCTAVMAISMLFGQTLHNLRALEPALAPDRIVMASVQVPRGYSIAQRTDLFDTLREHALEIPGANAAGYVHIRPLTGQGLEDRIEIEGRVARPDEDPGVLTERISPGFLAAMGMPFLAGRDFSSRDDAKAPAVAIVNESFARKFLSGGQVIGRRFRFAGDSHVVEIAGLVKDTRWLNLRQPASPMVFRPFRQDGSSFVTLAVRAASGLDSISTALQQAARQMRPPLEIAEVVPFTELEDRALFIERMIAQVATAFGLLALAIACVGVYGLLAYGVARRTREIGIRMALGASGARVQWLVLRESSAVLAMGFAVGVPAALAANYFARSLLFGLTAADPIAIAGALSVMTISGLAAAAIPARRAARIDPLPALRRD
jgi:predicted permease